VNDTVIPFPNLLFDLGNNGTRLRLRWTDPFAVGDLGYLLITDESWVEYPSSVEAEPWSTRYGSG